MATGFGIQPFGLGPFPAGPQVVTESRERNTKALRAVTAQRDLSPDTYVTPVQQRVQIIVGSALGSSIIAPEIGIQVPDFIDANTAAAFEASVRRALRGMVAQNLISIRSVTIEPDGSRMFGVVNFVDHTAGSVEASARTGLT